jgi:hypothetical protein
MLLSRQKTALFLVLVSACSAILRAQTATATATVTATPAGPVNQQVVVDPDKVMTREDRIKQHHERIEKIIAENRKKQEEQQKAAQAQMAVATGQNVANTTASSGLNVGGAALPTGPIQPATVAPPIQQAQKGQSQSPQAARSESRMILMFDPMDTVVNVGETFETRVMAETKMGTVDAVSFLLKYPKQLLNPLALNHAAIDPLVDDSVEYAFDPEAGEIYFRALLKDPTRLALASLVTITWEAIEPTDGTSLTFAFDPERPTGLFSNSTNLLGTVANANDGIIKSTIMVRAPRSKDVVEKVADNGLVITSKSMQPGPPVMQLHLEPSVISTREGQEFTVKVILDNDSGEPMDRVRLVAKFDPAELEVVDSDKGNRIRSGVNVEDGMAAEEFPFDFNRSNEVDNVLGTIAYDVGAEMNPVRGSGVLAAIHFRAKHATNATAVSLVRGEGGTDVSYLHSTMLAPNVGRGEPNSVAIRISPDPEGLRRAAAAKRQAPNPFRSRVGRSFQTD